MMKKLGLVLMVCLLVCPLGGLAQGKASTANGIVQAVDTVDITAPYSGTLLPFSWEQGDWVEASKPLFSFDTTKIYAPAAGKITLFAGSGDDTQDVQNQYGMLAAVEKSAPYLINATTRNAYNRLENKFIHNGETLYFKLIDDADEVGSGRVISTSGNGYVVEIAEKSFEMGERVKLYRSDEKNTSSCVGEGVISRAEEVPVTGMGRILSCHVQDGQTVAKGQLLFESVAQDAQADSLSVNVTAPVNGVLDGLRVASGQQVYKGQVLATIHDVQKWKVVAQVDEMDLSSLQIGSMVKIVFDSYPDQTVNGTVEDISHLGTEKQNATYYDVDIAFATQLDVRLLMSATVTLP